MFKSLLGLIPQPYASYIKFLPYVLVLSVGFYAAWYVQGIRINKLNVKVEQLTVDNEKCHASIVEERKTVTFLKSEIETNVIICNKTSKVKENEILRLRRICGGTVSKPGENVSDGSIIGDLNSLY